MEKGRSASARAPRTGLTLEACGQLAETILEAVRQPLVVVDADHRIQIANRAFRRHFGIPADEPSERPLVETAGGAWDVPRLRELLEQRLPEERSVDDFELALEAPRLGERVILVGARRLGDAFTVLAMEDVTERRAWEAELGREAEGRAAATLLLQTVAVLANEAGAFEDALAEGIERICRIDGWQLGHAYVATEREDDPVFVDSGHWFAEDEARFGPFRDAFQRGAVAEPDDAVARAARSGEVVQVRDLEASETFRHKRAARDAELTTSILVPVRVRDRVVAVLELFSESPRDLDHETASVMAEIGIQLGRVAERTEAERRIAEFTERTQARFSQELHDRVAQGLAGLCMMAGRLRDELGPDQRERVDHLVEGLAAAMDQVRSLSRALLPVDVEAEDLAAALDTLVRRFDALGPMTCRFECGPHARLRDSAVATHLFRLAQEALQNALEHSGAEHVTVRLNDGDRILLEIEDDGHGFEDRGSLGVGQRIMQHRADSIGARLSIASGPRGTTVRCELEPATVDSAHRTRSRRREPPSAGRPG